MAPLSGHPHGAAPSPKSGTSQQASLPATERDSNNHKVIKNSPLPCSVLLPLLSAAPRRPPPPSVGHQQPPNAVCHRHQTLASTPTGSHNSSAILLTLIEYLGRKYGHSCRFNCTHNHNSPKLRRNYHILIEKKTSRTISRKIRGSRKPQGSREAKQSKTTDNTRKTGEDTGANRAHGPCTQDPARPADQRSGTARPCWVAQPCHLTRTDHATWHSRAT